MMTLKCYAIALWLAGNWYAGMHPQVTSGYATLIDATWPLWVTETDAVGNAAKYRTASIREYCSCR